VCVVGRVGTGKSALLAGLIEEMRKTRGRVVLGGQVSYGESSFLTRSL
jgi:ABC-type branched-subunit amino acid transport system ATPase component